MPGSMERIPSIIADRYRVLDELGRGGMGVVFLARDLKHERDVAVKVLRSELVSAVETHRFHREIHIAAGLSHPHILPIYDSGEVEGLLYYVMPHVPGETLRERLRQRGQLSVPEVLTLGRNVAAALDHAHARDVVHRDIKPANIFLSGEEALVGDFGVAVVLDEALREHGDRLTSTGVSVGSPRYMSPEQMTEPDRVDGRSDVFSFGTVLFECLTGRLPFTGKEGSAHPLAWMAREPGELGDCPPPLADFVHRCLAVDPEERLPKDRGLEETWRTMEEEVARIGESDGGPGFGRRAVLAGGALLVTVTTVTVVSLLEPSDPEPRTVLRHEPVVTWPSREEEGRPIPGGAEVSFLSDRTGSWNVWAVALEGNGERRVTDEDGRVWSHVWSPDGSRLAYVLLSRDGSHLVLADGDGGAPTSGHRLPGRLPPRLLRWRDDGIHLLVDGELWSVDPATGRTRQLAEAGSVPTMTEADVHPRNDRVVLASPRREGGSDLWIMDLDGSAAERLLDDDDVDRSPCWSGPDEVAFVSNRGGGGMDVWRMRLSDRRPVPVTSGFGGADRLSCGTDGTSLIVDREEERGNLWVWSPRGNESDPLTFEPRVDLLPSVSRQGRIAFQRERTTSDVRDPFVDADIMVATLTERELTDVVRLVENAFHPKISADGRWVAFQRQPPGPRMIELGVATLSGEKWTLTARLPLGVFRPIPPAGWESAAVAWSDAAPVLFYVEASADPGPEGGGPHLVRARMGDGGPAVDTIASLGGRGDARGLAVSPDGRRLSYVASTGIQRRHELRVVELDGSDPRTVHREALADDLYNLGWTGPGGPIVALRSFRQADGLEEAQPLVVELDGTTREGRPLAGAVGNQARLDPSTGTLLVPWVGADTLELRRLPLEGAGEPSWTRVLRGVPFSGLEVLADGRILFSRHEIDPDIVRLVLTGPG